MENRPHSREKKVGDGSASAQRGRRIDTGGPVGGSSQNGRPGQTPGAPHRDGEPRREPEPERGRPGAAGAAGLSALFAFLPKKLRGVALLAVAALLLFSRLGGSQEETSTAPVYTAAPVQTAAPTPKPTAAPSYSLTPQAEGLESVDDANMMFSSGDPEDWAELLGTLFGFGESYSGSSPSSGGLLQDLPGVKPTATPKPTAKPKTTPKPSSTAKPKATPKPTATPKPVEASVRDKRVTPLGGGRDTVTVMVYMCGTDLESKYGMATSDLSEMTKARLSDKVNVLVETGGCRSWKNDVVSNSVNQIYRVHSGGLERLESSYGKAAMTDPANLTQFIRYCAEHYPANRNILILWDHGGGSISGYGYDEKSGGRSSMTLPQIDKALSDANVVFDWIGYDACLMSTLETALVSAKYADYLIASEEVEPGTGWYYTDWLSALSENSSLSTEVLGRNIIDSYVGACRARSRSAQVTLALTDLAELQARLPAVFRAFSVSTNSLISDNYRQVSTARAGARQFAQSTRINQVDLADLALRIGSDEGRALAQAVQSCVKYNGTTITKCYGLSIYFPYESLSSVSSAINTYDTLGLDSEYAKVIRSFASLEYGGQLGGGASQGSSNGYGGWDSLFGGSSGSDGYGSILEALLGSYSYAGESAYGGSAYGSSGPAGSLSGSYTNAYGQSSAGYSVDMSDLFGLFSAFSGRSMPADRAWVDTGLIAAEAEQLAGDFLDPGRITATDKNGTPVLSLSEEEWALVQSVELNLFARDGDSYLDLGLDNVFEYDGDGDLLLDFDGTWLCLNGSPVAYYLVSDSQEPDGSWITVGRIPALLNGDPVNLQVVFSSENPDGSITGAYPLYQNGETVTAPKGLVPLRSGDSLEFLCDCYGPDNSYSCSATLGTGFTVTGELTLENLRLDNELIPSFRITDLYGNSYWLAF